MKKTIIPETIEIQCQDCPTVFRWFPNSTIKPIRCKMCENKRLLSQSTLYTKGRSKPAKLISKTVRTTMSKYGVKKGHKSKAMRLADTWFSKYIRLKYSFESNGELICTCYTCNKPYGILSIQNGHWQRRGFKTTRYNADNARPQCMKCNSFRSGEPEKFELKLIKELGQERVNELKLISQDLGEDNAIFYLEQATVFRLLVKKLIDKIGINPWKKGMK